MILTNNRHVNDSAMKFSRLQEILNSNVAGHRNYSKREYSESLNTVFPSRVLL